MLISLLEVFSELNASRLTVAEAHEEGMRIVNDPSFCHVCDGRGCPACCEEDAEGCLVGRPDLDLDRLADAEEASDDAQWELRFAARFGLSGA